MKLILQGVTQQAVENEPWGYWLKKNILGQAGVSITDIGFTLNTLHHSEKSSPVSCLIFPTPSRFKQKKSPDILKTLLGITGIADYHGHLEMREGRMYGVTYHPDSVRANPNLLPVVIREISNLLEAAQYPKRIHRPKVVKCWA